MLEEGRLQDLLSSQPTLAGHGTYLSAQARVVFDYRHLQYLQMNLEFFPDSQALAHRCKFR